MEIKQVILFIVPYLAIFWGLQQWRKRKAEPKLFFFLSSWTLFYLSLYLCAVESQHHSYYWVIPLAFFLLFFLCYHHKKAQLLNGFLFNLFGISFGIYLLFNYFQTNNTVVLLLIIAVSILLLLFILFGFVTLTLLLYWNAIIVIRRESHSLANLLTLITALVLTLWLVYDYFIASSLPDVVRMILSILPMILLYFSVVFVNFLSASILYQFIRPKYNQDFVIVLGAGLLAGERVTPLLAQRIDKAIQFYHQQLKATGKPPKIVMSGGQGMDEKIPEAIAMKNYALTQGIPDFDLLVETNSTTTLENMKFSKEIIQRQKSGLANIIFTSNNYHIFRAGIFAYAAGLKAEGIGAKTALYYLPNAFLREFIAMVAMNRKRHLMIIILLVILILLLAIISLITSKYAG